MKITYIVTINPVEDIQMLNIVNHSLNLQTSKNFDVIFYNQTLNTEEEILKALKIKPNFNYKFYHIDKSNFLGKYPIWDLYDLHVKLLENNDMNDYFMSIHMEEFFDTDYTEKVSELLINNKKFDILLGNLRLTKYFYKDITELLDKTTIASFNNSYIFKKLKESPHWCYPNLARPSFYLLRSIGTTVKRFIFNKKINSKKARRNGFIKYPEYIAEDIYLMKTSFANKYNWFLKGHNLPFEDIHINGLLKNVLPKYTLFPVYFSTSNVYHLNHKKYFFENEDETFVQKLSEYKTDNVVIQNLQKANKLLKEKKINKKKARGFMLNNDELTGTQNLNYILHTKYLNLK